MALHIEELERAVRASYGVPGPLVGAGIYYPDVAHARELRRMGYGPVYAPREDPRLLPGTERP